MSAPAAGLLPARAAARQAHPAQDEHFLLQPESHRRRARHALLCAHQLRGLGFELVTSLLRSRLSSRETLVALTSSSAAICAIDLPSIAPFS